MWYNTETKVRNASPFLLQTQLSSKVTHRIKMLGLGFCILNRMPILSLWMYCPARRFRRHDNTIPSVCFSNFAKIFFLSLLLWSSNEIFGERENEYLIGSTTVKPNEINHRKLFSKMLNQLLNTQYMFIVILYIITYIIPYHLLMIRVETSELRLFRDLFKTHRT